MKKFKLNIDGKAICKVIANWAVAAVVAFVSSKLTGANFVGEWFLLSAVAVSIGMYNASKTCDCAECVCDPKADSSDF